MEQIIALTPTVYNLKYLFSVFYKIYLGKR